MIKEKITKEGLIIYDTKTFTTIRFNKKESEELLGKKIDFDEYDYHCRIAHLEISNQCDMNCPECYIIDKNEHKDLPMLEWIKIINKLDEYGIFQITFGGGEPLLYKDVVQLAKYCNEIDMPVALTTNGKYVKKFDKNQLKYFSKINVSWHGDKKIFEDALNHIKEYGITLGINYVVSKDSLSDYNYILNKAIRYNAELLFLSYKPVIGDWKNQIKPQKVLKLANKAYKKGGIWKKVAIDGLACDMCVGSKYFIDVDNRGNVLPCSFIREPIGNLKKEPFNDIWVRRKEIKGCPYKK